MTNIAVNSSTVRIVVDNDHDLNLLVRTYGEYVAIIHHDDGRQLLIYDSRTLLRDVVGQCLEASSR